MDSFVKAFLAAGDGDLPRCRARATSADGVRFELISLASGEHDAVQAPFVLGWEEWLALPELDLPALKVKVDTGARTSALAAFDIEEIGSADRRKVRFSVRPVPGRDDVVVVCVADVVDQRDVTSSNGETERRYVIRTKVRMGEREWPIEVTLASRSTMSYRMLLGRQAVQDDMLVEPGSSFRQPKLSYRVYGAVGQNRAAQRQLTLAILSRQPDNASNRRLAEQAERRGHVVSVIDRRRLSLYVSAAEPAILVNGVALTPPDAVVFRAGRAPSAFSLAIVRQMEMLGTFALNPADALARSGDVIVLRQSLAAARVAVPEAAIHPKMVAGSAGSEHVLADSLAALGSFRLLRIACVGGRALAQIERSQGNALETEPGWQAVTGPAEATDGARRLAEAAVKAIGLGLAAVDVALTRTEPIVVDVTGNFSLSLFERLTGAALAEAVIVQLERVLLGRPGRRADA